MNEIYPRFHQRYSSLPIFGSILEGYACWLIGKGYPKLRVRCHFQAARRLVFQLKDKEIHSLEELTRENLRACAPACSQDDADLAVFIRLIEQYLEAKGIFQVQPLTEIGNRLAAYRTYLEEVRGLAPSTVTQHTDTIAGFLEHLGYKRNYACLNALTGVDIESFVSRLGKRLSRASLQHSVAHLRAFLRFLGSRDEAPPGLDLQIDTPRVYRGERLPRTLSWNTVNNLLHSIDRSTIKGRRDYAMLLLMATYGLRSCEVVSLTLDDIQWRAGLIRIPQHKSANHLILPLTDEVGTGLVDYLQRGRPALPCREVFLRCRTPDGVLKPTAVTEAFQAWSRKSGLPIPFQGAHCIRHSYAVHLLRQGTPLKTIGDILGHRSAESTCVYLRLAIEDLRGVALPLPKESTADKQQEGVI
ncbi:site-specific integrase [Desulfosarcina ovata]|uniref:site-specific integrase n=1 Tax=Desulfosarcina ovata TaxID=83564 RepID=UPI00156417D4|nr:site-specific integrase [Desulfosarcina ovata]